MKFSGLLLLVVSTSVFADIGPNNYTSAEAAAHAAGRLYYQQSASEDREFIGGIIRFGVRYTYTVTAGDRGADQARTTLRLPSGSALVAVFGIPMALRTLAGSTFPPWILNWLQDWACPSIWGTPAVSCGSLVLVIQPFPGYRLEGLAWVIKRDMHGGTRFSYPNGACCHSLPAPAGAVYSI